MFNMKKMLSLAALLTISSAFAAAPSINSNNNLTVSGPITKQVLTGHITLQKGQTLTINLKGNKHILNNSDKVSLPISAKSYKTQYLKQGYGYRYNVCCIYASKEAGRNLIANYPRFIINAASIDTYHGSLIDDTSATKSKNIQGSVSKFCDPYGNGHHYELRCGYCARNKDCRNLSEKGTSCSIKIKSMKKTSLYVYCGLGNPGKTYVFPGYVKAAYSIH
jgi:hypothetical protein